MTLSEATALFEAKFENITTSERGQYTKDHPVYWSGGIRKFDESAWALYSSKEAAIVEWLDNVLSYVDEPQFVDGKRVSNKSLKWIVKPELMEYIITISDQRGQHRVVNNRFAVKSQFVMEG